jgi:two-component system sensor histidine kinase RegB
VNRAPAAAQAEAEPTSASINLRRLVGLRWFALAGQVAAVLVARYVEIPLPGAWLAVIVGGYACVTAFTWWRTRWPWPVGDQELFSHLLLDVAVLTLLLALTGSASNPFTSLYLLPLTLTAAALPGAYTWTMVAVTGLCYTGLVLLGGMPEHDHGGSFALHVIGMWIGFIVAAVLIAAFAVRMAQTLRERDRLAAEMREHELRHERIVALGTLAAGAAHELGTPLSTMAVLAQDLAEDALPAQRERVATLRAELRRCREILAGLSAAGNEVQAGAGHALPLDRYLAELVDEWRTRRPDVSVTADWEGPRPPPVVVGDRTLGHAIQNIMNNAADVSPDAVEIEGRWDDARFMLEVRDRGPGLTPEARRHAGNTVYSSKAPEQGLGLGLFLSRAALQRLGGDMEFSNRAGGGTCIRLTLPLQPLRVTS